MPTETDPLTVTLDEAAGITARVWIQQSRAGGRRLVLALHDPARTDTPGEDDEVYALLLPPDRAWELGTVLTRVALGAR